jgi:hypothetical protein
MLGLGTVMPYKYTQIVLLALGGVLTVVGAVMGPETKDIDFSSDVAAAEEERAPAASRRPAREPA